MTDELDKESLQDLLVRRALGELAPEELEWLERALATNPALAADAASLESTLDLLGRSVRSKPPARLRARLLESARRELGVPVLAAQPERLASRPIARRRSWRFVTAASIAAAATVAGAVLVVDDLRLRRSLELHESAAAMLREPNIVLSFSLKGSGTAAAATGLVLLDLDARRASIAVRDLPPLPPTQSYHLWAQLGAKNVLCGEFTPRADGRILTQFAIPVDSYTAPIDKLILTIEAEAEPAAPLGAIAMSS